MTRNLNMLGLTLAAVFALSAVVASAAMAEKGTDYFHSDSSTGNTILTGEQTAQNVFKVTNEKGEATVSVTCPKAKFEGTQSGNTAEDITIHPIYQEEKKECEAAPIGKASVETKGCNYTFTGTTDSEEHAQVHLTCEAGKSIKIKALLCTITIEEQTPTSGGVHYTNENPGTTTEKAVKVKATVKGIHYKSAGSGCSLIGLPAEGITGDYEGEATVKGYVDNEGKEEGQTGIWYEAVKTE